MSLLDRFKTGLSRSREGFVRRLEQLFNAGEINEAFYEQLEEILVAGDAGVSVTTKLLGTLQAEARRLKLRERRQVHDLLIKTIAGLLVESPQEIPWPADPPLVILVIGVNGAGKTTTTAKLAHRYRMEQRKVLLVAGDTFRAAAIDQLQIWAQRAQVELIRQQPGSDPSAIFFDAMNAARARGADVVIGDTAGRLHTKVNLMGELEKIYRVIGRCQPGAPHEVLLVLDATTGQNGIAQASCFNRVVPVSGLVLTKLDGTARGGIVLGIRDALQLPVRYVGIGEKIDDLVPFVAEDFARALLE